jgi:hypothetical protein
MIIEAEVAVQAVATCQGEIIVESITCCLTITIPLFRWKEDELGTRPAAP